MGEEIEMPTVDYRASYLAASAELKEARQRAERAKRALQWIVNYTNPSQSPLYDQAGLGELFTRNMLPIFREALAALADDPQPPEAVGEGTHAQVLTADGWVDPNWPSPEAGGEMG